MRRSPFWVCTLSFLMHARKSAAAPRMSHVFNSTISLAGACVKSAQAVLHLASGWTNFIPLSAHKPRQNRFWPEIPLVGACVKSVQHTLNLTNGGTNFISLQAPSEQVLPRNLLTRGLCKISPICITSYKWMNKFYFTTLPQAPSEHVLPRNLLSGGLVQNQSSMHYTLQTDEQIFLHDWPTVQETSKLSFCHIFAPSCGPTRCSWRLWSHRVMCNGLIWSESATLPKSKNAKLGPSRTSGIHWRALEHQGQ